MAITQLDGLTYSFSIWYDYGSVKIGESKQNPAIYIIDSACFASGQSFNFPPDRAGGLETIMDAASNTFVFSTLINSSVKNSFAFYNTHNNEFLQVLSKISSREAKLFPNKDVNEHCALSDLHYSMKLISDQRSHIEDEPDIRRVYDFTLLKPLGLITTSSLGDIKAQTYIVEFELATIKG